MAQQPLAQVRPIGQLGPVDSTCSGYPKVARLMAASAPGAIFRKFGELQMVNLLRLQARLQNLEQEYRDVRTEDATSGEEDRMNLLKDFRQMREMAEPADGESEQHDVLNKIGEALKDYSKGIAFKIHADSSTAQLLTNL